MATDVITLELPDTTIALPLEQEVIALELPVNLITLSFTEGEIT
jgi:hypothetical protein